MLTTHLTAKQFFSLRYPTIEKRILQRYAEDHQGERLLKENAMLLIRQDLEGSAPQVLCRKALRKLYFAQLAQGVFSFWSRYLLARFQHYFTKREVFRLWTLVQRQQWQTYLLQNMKKALLLGKRAVFICLQYLIGKTKFAGDTKSGRGGSQTTFSGFFKDRWHHLADFVHGFNHFIRRNHALNTG